jgi:hypothetical protein
MHQAKYMCLVMITVTSSVIAGTDVMFIEPPCDIPQGDDACWLPFDEPLYFVQWNKSDGGTDDYYAVKVYDRPVPWWKANRDAQSMGGSLAQITSLGENNHIYFIAVNTPGAFTHGFGPWIGAFRCPPQGGDPTAGWTWCIEGLPGITFGSDYENFPAGELDGSVVLPWRACLEGTGGPSGFWAQVLPTPQAGSAVHSAVIELPLIALVDCNENGIPDSNEILDGAADVNGNWVPDECDCLADLSGDRIVNVPDLLEVLDSWGSDVDAGDRGDVNWDGVVDVGDLLSVIGAFGRCPF